MSNQDLIINNKAYMSWGLLSKEQEEAILPYITGREVYDIGAGDCVLSKRLLELGASGVVAIDKEFPRAHTLFSKKITLKRGYFGELVKDKEFTPEIVFISWPANNHASDDLAEIVTRAKVTIYLGTNFDGTMCGSSVLFSVLAQRKLLSYIPAQKNNLIIVSDEIVDRELTPEEEAVLGRNSDMKFWHEAHKKWKTES